MSTHLEHGTRLPVLTLTALNSLIHTYTTQVASVAQKRYDQQCAMLTYQILDEALLQLTYQAFLDAVRQLYATAPIADPQPFEQTDLRWIVRHIIADHQTHVVRTQERDPEYDWACDLLLIPHHTGIYVLLYAEQEIYHQLWRALPVVQDYAYWNHTDPPDGMSRNRWERRSQRWNALLGPRGIPAEVGLSMDIYNPLIAWENRFWKVKPDSIPDFDARVRHWAFTRAVAEMWEQEDPQDRGFRTVFRTQDWIKTPEGASHFETLQQSLRHTLPAVWETDWVHQSLDQIWDRTTTLRQAAR